MTDKSFICFQGFLLCVTRSLCEQGLGLRLVQEVVIVVYRIAGMFGRDKVWQIASSKVVGEKIWRIPTAALRGLLL